MEETVKISRADNEARYSHDRLKVRETEENISYIAS